MKQFINFFFGALSAIMGAITFVSVLVGWCKGTAPTDAGFIITTIVFTSCLLYTGIYTIANESEWLKS